MQILKLWFLSAFYLASNNVVAKQSPHYEVKVVTELLEPYQVYNHDGSLGGFSTDVVTALFRHAGSKAQIEVMPWARAYSTALSAKNVMIYSITKSASRNGDFYGLASFSKKNYATGRLVKMMMQNN